MKRFPVHQVERFVFLLLFLRELSCVKFLDFCFDARLEGKKSSCSSFCLYVCFLRGDHCLLFLRR